MTVKMTSRPRHARMTAQAGAAEAGGAQARIAEAKGEPFGAPRPQPAAEESQQTNTSPIRFALYWFGVPVLVVMLIVIIRMQCGVGN